MKDRLQWTTPAPLWGAVAAANGTAARRDSLTRPAILRFASDDFMQDFLALMENDPARLADLLAQPETWRGPAPPIAPVKALPKFLQPLSRLRLAAERKQGSQAGGAQTGLSPGQSPQQLASELLKLSSPLKLYQPVHQRYYLLTACLVCARTGLPDRTVNPGRQERVGFVVRRLLPQNYKDAAHDNRGLPVPLPAPDDTWDEYALVTATEGRGWRKADKSASGSADVLLDGEELLPLFPVNYQQDDGHKRRVHGGLVPVGRREAYMGAPLLPPPQTSANGATTGGATNNTNQSAGDTDKPVDPRMMPLWLQVTEPWKRLIERADAIAGLQNTPPDPTLSNGKTIPDADKQTWIKGAREQIQTGSWYILLDFTKYLAEHLPDVWQVILGQKPESFLNAQEKDAERKVYQALKTTALAAGLMNDLAQTAKHGERVMQTLVDALKAIETDGAEVGLESVAASYVRDNPDPAWPKFWFPFADPTLAPMAGPLPASFTVSPVPNEKPVDTANRTVQGLSDLIEAALPIPTEPPPPESSLPLVAQRPLDMREGWFALRCVYERPECGPVDPPLLSATTAPFQMAGFFDPDAPARPLRIALPIDTSPAGLRKFDKNAAFVMSDMLCGQVNRMKGITLGDLVLSVLPWPFHKDLSVPDGGPCSDGGLQLGMICSLSIPIITICALLMLMIIVTLLDFIFRWLPYFLICFPLPKFSAGKKQGA
jgi:hypothetical protein